MATSAGNIPISATFAAAQLEKDVLSALNRIQSKSNLSLNTRNFSQPLGKITGLANEFQKSLEASNARVVAFGASAGLIYAVQKSFSSLVNTTIEVEKSLTDINVVLNTSSKGIKQFGDQLFNVAKNTGSAFKDVASAATEFSRQGLGLEETLKRTRDALILTRLSGLDVVSSTEALTAAVNSFTKEALTTTDVVNKLAAVDAKFAVSSRDLSEAIQRVGSSASEAGVSFDELLGIVTSVQQTTARGGAVIGNALKTIFTRIERPQVISDLKDFGIAVTDISGNALPTIKVIENLAQSFQNLNPVVKSQVAELVGGVYQINILKAALADVSKQNSAFAEATRTSSKAADEAILKNKALNESLSALLNETTINFTKFATSIGEASVGPGIRKVLGYINSSLEAYNEKDAEGVGEKIATGVLTGVTNFITGPGLGIGAFAIGKLLANFTKFAGDATKNILGLNTLGRQQAVLQSEIGKILSDNPDLIKDIISGSRTRLQVEQQIKQTLIEQAALAEQIKNSSIDIGGRFLASGLRVSEKNTIVGRRSAEGYIPAKQQAAEMVGAMQGGYAPGRVVAAPKSIGGVMNTAETVKYIPGFAQPYILPPQGSRAAQALASKSMAKNGINPYMARGFVPNFGGTDFSNPYGYGDDQWFRDGGKNLNSVPLSQIKITNAAGDVSGFDGKNFYKKDKDGNEKKFTAIDLNAFLKRGATYGEIRRHVPISILKTDARYGKRKPDGSVFTEEDIRKDFVPGKKIEAEQNIKEEIKKVYDPYIPPASILVFDAMQKSSERDVNEDDLEKTGEMSTKRKTSGRIFKIKSYALNASALNEEKTGLIQKTQDFSRKMTKDLANYIRPGEYSDGSVDEFFNRAGKNYNVLAGTIFEASTNLAANYTRDKANSGGDFDVRGGNIGNIRQLFPGFTDQYGDYKLKNNDEAIRSFIDKVTKQYGQQIGNHFKEQEIKAGSVTSGFKTSSFGFIPNFAGGFGGLSKLSFLFKTGSKFSSLINPLDVVKLMTGKGSIKDVFQPLVPLMKNPSDYIKSASDLEAAKSMLSTLYSSDTLREQGAKFLSSIIKETNFESKETTTQAEDAAERLGYGKDSSFYDRDYLKYRLFGGKQSLKDFSKDRRMTDQEILLKENPDGTYRFNENHRLGDEEMQNVIGSARKLFTKGRSVDPSERLLEPRGKGGKFLGVTFKMGRYIGDLGRTRRAIRYQDTWDVNLHQNENQLLQGYLTGKLSKNDITSALKKHNYSENYHGDLNSLILRELVSAITNPATIKGIIKIPKDKRFSEGYIPNFLKQPKIEAFKTGQGGILAPSAIVNKVDKENFVKKALEGEQEKSFLKYSSKDGSIEVDYVRSSRRGDGGKLWDRAGAIARELKVPLTTSAFLPQKQSLEQIDAETTSFGDVVATAFPQLKWSERGLAKKTKLTINNDHSDYPIESKQTFLESKNLLNTLFKYNSPALKDSILGDNTYIKDIISYFAKGYIPNFNPIMEAMNREMSAGYSASQVRLGRSDKLKTSFNPMGLGVYNSTEGSLNNGIGLAEKAGIDPKTKGMSSKGHIPNFADFGGADAFILIAAFGTLSTALKEVAGSLRTLKGSSDSLIKSNTSAAASYSQQIGQIPKDFKKSQKAISDEIERTFTNVNKTTLKLQGTATGPLVGKTTRDQFGIVTSSPVAASPEQVARLEELRKQQSELRKKAREELSAAREGRRQAEENIRQAQAPVFSRASFASGGQADRYVRGLGTQIGLIGTVIANTGGQFISPENKTGRAAASGLGEVASFAGLGAQFGPYGAIVGAIVGAGSAFLKIKDAKAEEAIDKINKSLGETKERSAEFSGAAQNYSTSLEGLQNALNDPKTKPEALLKFQNILTEALNSIPEEFRNKVLAAGTEISKVTEAIGEVNKEMANTQKNLERQLAITQFIEKQSSFLGRSSLKPKDQEVFNRLFTSSIRSEDITKKFTGENAAADFSKFIDSLKSQAIIYSQETIGPYGSRIGAQPMVNKESVENIKAQLKQNTVIPEEIIDQLDKAFAEFDTVALSSLFDSLKKAGIDVFDFAKRSKNLGEILAENTKRLKENEEVLKSLNNQYNDINLQISNQIDIEKNRAQTIREINKIQAEGAVSIQRARVKGLLESATPFISESSKSDIQNQLDLNETTSRQNSKIQEASNKLLDSFSNTIIKKSEEARSKVIPAIEGAKSENAIQQERAVFQNQIQKLTPLIAESLKQINSGGNIGDIQTNLINNIRGFSQFKPEERDVLVQTLEVSFGEFQNTLAEIKAQGDIDIQIQEAQREYQKQSLELNQRLSFAGGAQALSSTGKAGVSELFDNISELVSEFRQTNVAGNAAQRGSSAFKLLDVLTNQLQLNRSIGQPSGFIGPSASGSAFNNQVSSDLNPLVGTAIAGRVQQIRESVDLARRVTEIQMGKSTAGTALGTAFDQAKEGAVKTALDQITSQFKLENMGNYLDVLQQEARFLNDLTQDQNSILEKTLPTTINENFNRVITEQVGSKLDSLTTSLQGVINKLGVTTKRNALESEMFNKLPADVSPADRQAILNRIAASQNLRDTEGSMSMQTNNAEAGIRLAREKEIKKLQDYFKSFDLVTVTGAEGAFTKAYKNLIGDPSKVSRDDYGNITGGISYGKGYYGTGTSRETINNAVVLQEDLGSSYEDQLRNQKRLEQLIASREKSIGRPEINLSGTYKGLTQDINRDFKVSMAEEAVKSIKFAQEELRRLDSASPLMSVGNKSTAPSLQDIIDKYGLADQGGAKRNLPTQLAQGRANLDSINNLLLARLENDKQLVDLNEKVNNLLKEDLNDTKKREDLIKLQTELRKKTLEQEGKVAEELYNLYYKGSFGETFFKDERAAFANAKIENEARQGNVDIGAITEKNTTYNRADFARDTGQLIDTFQTDFKSGIASAFGEAIKGTKTLKDAFRDMFQGILNRMLDKSLEMGVDALFAFGKAAATGRKDGGLIRGYNSGGMVVGGSGMKDDVPAMMSGGEFVIKKSSVKKYGSDYLRALNGGLVPKYAAGGFSMGPLQNEFLYDNPDRPTSGEFAIDSRLSAAALTDENNPQNRLRQDRYEKLDQYLQDRAQYERDKQQALKNYKNQVNSTFYSGLTAAAVQLGAAGLTVGAEKLRTGAGNMPSKAQVAQAQKSGVTRNASGQLNMAIGGYIARFAGGGSTGKDNIPALLMGGEYVMNKKAVDMYGRDFMNQLNTGTLPKYASGGMVGTSYTAGQNTPESSVTELVAALNTLNENLSKGNDITQAESGKISSAGKSQDSGMSVVNNISINVAQSGEVTSEANATTQNGGSNTNKDQNSIQNNAKLAELLRSKVVEVLVEQKRPGGLLYASR